MADFRARHAGVFVSIFLFLGSSTAAWGMPQDDSEPLSEFFDSIGVLEASSSVPSWVAIEGDFDVDDPDEAADDEASFISVASHASPSGAYAWLELAKGSGAGSPVLSAKGSMHPGGSVQFTVTAQQGQLCMLVFGTNALLPGTSFAGAKLVLANTAVTIAMPLSPLGKATRSFKIVDASPTAYVQAITIDAAGHLEISNALGANRGHQWVVDPTPISWSPRNGHGMGVLGNLAFLVGGRPSTLATNDVHRFDGVKWVQLLPNDPNTTSRFSPRSDAAVAQHGGRLWVGLGSTNSGYATDLWSSSDGSSWTLESGNLLAEGGPGPRKNARAISFGGKLYVLGGYYKVSSTQKPTTFYSNEVWAYDSGQDTWTRTVAPWQGREDHAVAVHGGRLYVIGGSAVADDSVPYTFVRFNDVWSTANGSTWKLETAAAAFLPMIEHSAESFMGELQLFGGYQNTFNYQWRSSTGSSWTVPLELGGPGYSFGNQPVASAAKDAMPDIVRYDAVSIVFKSRLWSIGGFSVSQPYNHVVYSD